LGFYEECRILSHYFENDQNLTSKPRALEASFAGRAYTFLADRGVFSARRLDYGTKVLIDTLLKEELGSTLLDLGCGYGPIGIVLADQFPDLRVTMADVNRRSIDLAQANVAVRRLDTRVSALVSNGYEQVADRYDTIVTNPPIRAGKESSIASIGKPKTICDRRQAVPRRPQGPRGRLDLRIPEDLVPPRDPPMSGRRLPCLPSARLTQIPRSVFMEKSKKEFKLLGTNRRDYSKISGTLPLPNLVEVQTESYKWLIEAGLDEALKDVFPITNYADNLELQYLKFRFDEPTYTYLECKERDMTYSAPLRVTLRLISKKLPSSTMPKCSWAISR
jgi:16S rRNA (guanine1207-N2)-methyltransferase